MKKLKIFISSVQKEFSAERVALYDYLQSDPLLSRFFETFLFENFPAVDNNPDALYLDQVRECDIYIGLIGKQYGIENSDGLSPTHHSSNVV